MDITLNPVSRTSLPYVPQPVKAASGSPADATASMGQILPVQPIPATAAPKADEAQAIRQAAISFRNVYALSDQQFTIFKDASGKYITRYVSLRDGKVTYIPDPTLVKEMQIKNASAAPGSIAISV